MSGGGNDPSPFEEPLRRHALSYPEAYEEFPWGHSAIKIKGKAFLFMSTGSQELSLSVKLPESRDIALMMAFAQPTGYGLGKSGWVSASFAPGVAPPLDMLMAWIDESYRAIAPKKLVAQLDAGGTAPAPAAQKPAARKAAARKATAKKATAKKATAKKATAKKATAKKATAKTAAKKTTARKAASQRARQS